MGMFSLIDSYASSWGLLICAITEVVLVMWIYGFKRFFKNIEEMGIKIPIVLKGYWTIMWVIITPLILLLVLIIIGAVYAWVKRYQSGRPTDLRSMISPNDKWCSAVEDANKSRSGIANVSYVKDSDTIKY